MIGDKIEEWWSTPEHERVLSLVREVGVWRLGNQDGCTCCSFEIRNVSIDVSCGKGRPRGVWIHTDSADYYDEVTRKVDATHFRAIGDEVRRQVEESDGRGPAPVHYHKWEPDKKARRP